MKKLTLFWDTVVYSSDMKPQIKPEMPEEYDFFYV